MTSLLPVFGMVFRHGVRLRRPSSAGALTLIYLSVSAPQALH